MIIESIVKTDADYTYLKNEDEKIIAVDNHTGEISDTVNVLVPVGSLSYTPKQQSRYKKRKEKEQKKEFRKLNKNELGHFYFIFSEKEYADLKPQTLVRLVYLATFLKYETNELFQSERTPLKKSDLPKIMNLSRKSFYRFWSEVCDVYLFESDDGTLYLSKDFCRGKLAGYFRQNDERKSFQQVYISALRKLYLETPAAKHGYLGYIFQMLPYINWEFNILCWNPDETDIEKIDLMSFNQWCDVINYDKSNRARLMKIYFTLTFKWKNKRQRFCTFVPCDYKSEDMRIFVNPNILYRGSNFRRVEVLGLFFKDIDARQI